MFSGGMAGIMLYPYEMNQLQRSGMEFRDSIWKPKTHSRCCWGKILSLLLGENSRLRRFFSLLKYYDLMRSIVPATCRVNNVAG